MRVSEPKIDEQLAALLVSIGKERDTIAVVGERRRQEDLAAAPLLGEQRLREAAGPVEDCCLRQILGVDRFAPVVAKLVEREAELPLDGSGDAERRRILKDLADGRVTPPLADVLPKRLAVAIREVFVRPLRHLLDRRKIPIDRGVAQPRRRERMHRADRQVLGHSLHEPEGRIDLVERLQIRARLAAREDVELELVHHLVRENVVEAAEISGERENQAVPQSLSDSARAFAEISGNVVLPEL